MEQVKREIESLMNDRIWVTKKTRIEAEARLNFNSTISDALINYYTFALLAFSIWCLVLDSGDPKAQNITLVTCILSVGLFGITLFLSSIGFKQKALQFKESYLKLDALESELRHLLRLTEFKSKQEIIVELFEIEKKYNQILALTDNHNSIDFERLTIMKKLRGLTTGLVLGYYAKATLKWFVLSVIVAFPVLLIFLV